MRARETTSSWMLCSVALNFSAESHARFPVVTSERPEMASENGYDERQANIRRRVWYVALKKRF
jgi:hypothetical protein